MATTETIWPLEPHTAAKHQLLGQYLDAWYPILGSFNKRVVFLDGFAGPGIYAGGEPGSPEIALSRLLDHSAFQRMPNTEFVFVFNERDKERFDSLENRVATIRASRQPWPSNVRVHTKNESFVSLGEQMLSGLNGKSLAPTFAFLDPFGYKDVPIELIQRLVKYRRIELFIYWDYNSMNRFSTAGTAVDPHLEALFGTDEFKSAPPAGDPKRKQFLHDLYQQQLRDVCGFDYVQSFEMVNADNRTGYYLFFCTRDLTGFDRMKSVMWKVDPIGGRRFSDVLAGKTVLFQEEVDTAPLRAELMEHFAGQTVSIQEITNFVIGHTPYVSTHVKRKTLAPMQKDEVIACPGQKTRGQFPDGTLVSFPAR
ncbi:three-Cys-motif partner protein TcmP [Microbacterium sp.]|uniref:three-Cys-motif partner protein TcmP n=1 Tax=Microbacterium sp. TaxID=51671 RepID=UPI0035B3DECF